VIWGVICGVICWEIWGVMPKVILKTHFKKIMLTLRLYCHIFSVGMQLMSDFRLVVSGSTVQKILDKNIFLSKVVRVLVKSKTRTNTNVSYFDKS
jgi:hypothetical protein